MEHGTSKNALIEIQKLGIPRHLSNVLLSDFGECCQFNDAGELIRLDVEAITKKVSKDEEGKYTELMQALRDNYLLLND